MKQRDGGEVTPRSIDRAAFGLPPYDPDALRPPETDIERIVRLADRPARPVMPVILAAFVVAVLLAVFVWVGWSR